MVRWGAVVGRTFGSKHSRKEHEVHQQRKEVEEEGEEGGEEGRKRRMEVDADKAGKKDRGGRRAG
jgi:hypothetical protein